MTQAVILDLDGTVIDTTGIQALRDALRWKDCARHVKKTMIFPGIPELLETLAAADLRLGLCTSAVSFYARTLLEHHEVRSFDAVICYHDAKPPKPHPAPILATLAKLKALGAGAVGVGDRSEDAQAYRAAGVYSIGAGWNPALERAAAWDVIAATPADVARIAAQRR